MNNHCRVASPLKNENSDKIHGSSGEKKSFGSLAEMTAHHLQKSNNSSPLSPKSPFVIPKLSQKPSNSSSKLFFTPNKKSIKTTINVNTPMEIDKNNSVQTNDELDKKDEELQVTTDDWVIDLTKALLVTPNKNLQTNDQISKNKNSKSSKDFYDIKDFYQYSSEPIPSSLVADHINILHCSFNLKQLGSTKLPYSNKKASNFGKTLCRKWIIRKPYIKPPVPESIGNIKKFDFSTNSPDDIILANLQRL